MNMPASYTLMDHLPQDAFKIEMLLKEAELFQHDIKLISFASSQGKVEQILRKWLSAEDNLYTGRLGIYVKSSRDISEFESQPKLKINFIADSLRGKKIEEALVIGKDVAVINAEGETSIHRNKAYADLLNKISRSILRVSLIERQQEQS